MKSLNGNLSNMRKDSKLLVRDQLRAVLYRRRAESSISAKCFTSDGGKHVADALAESGEPWPVGLSAYRDTVAPLSGYDMWKIQAARTSFAKEVYDRWNATSQVTSVSDRAFLLSGGI